MTVRMTLQDGTRSDLESLIDWLRRDEGLRGRVEWSPSVPKSGEMGVISDTLVVALGSGGALTALAAAVPAWLKYRRSDLTITIEDGPRRIQINATNLQDAESLIRLGLTQGSSE